MTEATGASEATAPRAAPGRRTVMQGGRAKAYRPLPSDERRAAFDEAIAAYARGDYFEAHELLEPAWMGTDEPAERDLHQGLIKLAAAYVHAVRGNPLGIGKNLVGARERLAAVVASGESPPGSDALDVPWLVEAIDARLAALEAGDLVAARIAPSLDRRGW